MNESEKKAYLREKEVAKYTGLSLPLLRKRRRLGLPPTFSRVGRAVVYSRRLLDEYIESCAVATRDGAR